MFNPGGVRYTATTIDDDLRQAVRRNLVELDLGLTK